MSRKNRLALWNYKIVSEVPIRTDNLCDRCEREADNRIELAVPAHAQTRHGYRSVITRIICDECLTTIKEQSVESLHTTQAG